MVGCQSRALCPHSATGHQLGQRPAELQLPDAIHETDGGGCHRNGLEIVLVYYPPYHSKYNPIDRWWGLLENHWNGTLLDNVTTVLNWAGTMTWKGLRPIVHLLEATYEKGVRVAKKAFQEISQRLQRDKLLPKYFVRISPASCVG